MGGPLVLSCDVADYNGTTGECAAPYYTQVPTVLPVLSLDEGAVVALCIVGTWTLGLIARLYIRAMQQGSMR